MTLRVLPSSMDGLATVNSGEVEATPPATLVDERKENNEDFLGFDGEAVADRIGGVACVNVGYGSGSSMSNVKLLEFCF